MNNESFEKMDRKFFNALKDTREKKVPEGIRRNFKRSVEERLLSAVRPSAFGLSFIMAPAIVLVLGAALCWFYLKPGPPISEKIPAEGEFQKKEMISQMAEVHAPVFIQPAVLPLQQKVIPADVKIDNQPGSKLPDFSQISESNVVSELEVLKELGVWTEKDDEEIGVTSDQIFEELETLAGELLSGGTAVNVPKTSTQS